MAFVLRKHARPGDPIAQGRSPAPVAPGAVTSPQIPGEVPDRSSVPEQGVLPVPVPDGAAHRPLSEYGTSQVIMGVYDKDDLAPDDPARFVQAPPSYEEQRKATPALRTPVRPQAGYALTAGTRLASQTLAELSAEAAANAPLVPGE